MKIVFISDTHNKHGQINPIDLPEADMIICSGDISSRGYKDEVKNFLYWYSSLSQYKHKIMIAGNHDFLFEDDPEEVKNIMPENVTYLQDSGIQIEGLNIWGSPVQPIFYNWAFNRYRGSDIEKHWNLIPDNTNILVTHGPPYNILDFVVDGSLSQYNQEDNVGCKDLMKKVNTLSDLKVHVFGHIHANYGVLDTNGVKFINASLLNEQYKLANKPIIVDL